MKTVRVAAAVIFDGDRVFATRRGHGEWKGYWEFPGGKIEPGETPEEALCREIVEELDTVISVGEKIANVTYDYPDFRLDMDCFAATVEKGSLELKEHDAAMWLSPDELDEVDWLPADNEVIDAIREKWHDTRKENLMMDSKTVYPFDEQSLLAGVEAMNACGPRTTGSAGHNRFVDYIKTEIASMGLEYKSDIKYFDRWEAKRSSIVIHSAMGDIPVHVSSPFPYSGETPPEGVTSEVVPVLGKHLDFFLAKDKIAVVRLRDFKSVYSGIAFNRKSAVPDGLRVQEYYKGPVATAFVKFPFLQVARDMGVKACICIWEKMSDAMVEGQYLNFILDYQGIPALWVNETDGAKVLEACDRGDKVTLTLEAEKEAGAKGETVCAVIKGENDSESIIVNTHTDGVNCVEENGAIAMLAMMRYFLEHKPRRTIVFAFVCGHFRLPKFKAPGAIGDQATSLWLHDHKEMWDGKEGHRKAVAGLTPEHLGCSEWKDFYGEYRCTDPVDIEVVYTGNKKMDEIYLDSLEGRTKVRTVTLRGHNFLHFGEGQSLFNAGIPEIALVTSPDYLCVESENHEMDKFDPDLMYQQTVSFIKMAEAVGELDAGEIGKADGYTFGVGRV